MRLSLRQRLGRYKISLVIGTITKVQGVNSNLRDGNHITMWDFDEPKLELILSWLWPVQAFYSLPAIHIAQSHPGGGYHAYCLQRMEWLQSVSIVSATHGIDPGYVSMCAMRGHWTLRLSDKGRGVPSHVAVLPSGWPEDVKVEELTSWVNYEVWSSQKVLTFGRRGL